MRKRLASGRKRRIDKRAAMANGKFSLPQVVKNAVLFDDNNDIYYIISETGV